MKKIKMDIDKIDIFRKATPEDIVEGNVVYLVGDNDEMYKKIIDEVYNLADEWKAFCADDGCRYGLEDLYVLKSGAELEKRIAELEKVVSKIHSTLADIII